MKKPTPLQFKLIVSLACLFAVFFIYTIFFPIVTKEAGVTYFLVRGTSKTALITDLANQGLIRQRWLFSIYSFPHRSSQIKAGEYVFPKGASPASIWRQVISGKGLHYRTMTIIPGWSFKQVREALAKTDGLVSEITKMDNQTIMAYFGEANLSPEGQFFPDTYFFTRNDTDLSVLKRAYRLMQDHLTKAWNTRTPDLPFGNAYEALIAASLVEKEAYLASERPRIAGVLVNRLQKAMPLQFDPTIIFGMGDFYDGTISKQDLVTDTPYNTYVHKGLPPTPIAIPSAASINAVLHPDVTDYLYFVAKGDGGHQFSKTLEEHNKAVLKVNTQGSGYFNGALIRRQLETLLEIKHG
ncbi:MAG: hypothetical protein A3F14_01120 [Gammaproteobacteria bacterium RIFCSPHIGHO2_12_FULL_43_28]|nr:MAG: hypothetical protein A3F14_01120 [Gammaproteobacteria bacterium RIFCSPHIGHO2_12_FULL_43_28]